MPKTIPPTLTREALPSVATIAEISAFERVDYRTVKKAIAADQVPGVFARGRSWRVCTDIYLAQVCHVLDGQHAGSEDEDA